MKKAMRAAGCIITVILTIGLLMWTVNLTERKESSNKYSDFFKDRDYDVLFMGTSHVINSVFPMELWKEYGITSYNCGGTSNYLPTTYWVLQNALDYVTPKVVVIDCLRLADDEKCPYLARAHYSLDAFPLSKTKIDAIRDLMDNPGGNTALEAEKAANIAQSPWLELLWDFTLYHSRWNELEKDDFSPAASREKGAETRIDVVPGKLKRIDRELAPLTLDDGSQELWTLYKGKFAEPSQTGHTDTDSMQYQHPTIEATFIRRECDNSLAAIAATADENVMESAVAGWFETVYEARIA